VKRNKKENGGYTWLSTSLYMKNGGGEMEEKLLRKNPTWKENTCN